jgi:hypothetical protein
MQGEKGKKDKILGMEVEFMMMLGLQVQSLVSAEYFPYNGDSRVISNSRETEVKSYLLCHDIVMLFSSHV